MLLAYAGVLLIIFIGTYICIHICVDKDVMLDSKVAEEYWVQNLGEVTACYLNNG